MGIMVNKNCIIFRGLDLEIFVDNKLVNKIRKNLIRIIFMEYRKLTGLRSMFKEEVKLMGILLMFFLMDFWKRWLESNIGWITY